METLVEIHGEHVVRAIRPILKREIEVVARGHWGLEGKQDAVIERALCDLPDNCPLRRAIELSGQGDESFGFRSRQCIKKGHLPMAEDGIYQDGIEWIPSRRTFLTTSNFASIWLIPPWSCLYS
jgi:hypothetical protein